MILRTTVLACVLLPLVTCSELFAFTVHDAYQSVANHAESILCQADELKAIAKTNLRRTDCYRKIRGNIALLKLTSGKVKRRARSIRRANWEKELNRIDERIGRIAELVDVTYQRSAQGTERLLANCCLEINSLLDGMAADLQCMRIALNCPVPNRPNLGTPHATQRSYYPQPHLQPLPQPIGPTEAAPRFPVELPPVELPTPILPNSTLPGRIVPAKPNPTNTLPQTRPSIPTAPPRRSILDATPNQIQKTQPNTQIPKSLKKLKPAQVVPYSKSKPRDAAQNISQARNQSQP